LTLHSTCAASIMRSKTISYVLVLASQWSLSSAKTCKSIPGDVSWPCSADWKALNTSIDGRLLKPPPPAAVCHPSWPTYNPAECKAIDWTSATTYANDPIGIINPNWSNDSCLPQPQYGCSDEGSFTTFSFFDLATSTDA
jgi:hypothetical protein